MEHFYDSTGMTILILSWMYMHDKKVTYCDKHVSSRKCIFFVVWRHYIENNIGLMCPYL